MGETDYNTLLYEKMKAEKDKYRDWLLTQEPAEILNHIYEYTISLAVCAAALSALLQCALCRGQVLLRVHDRCAKQVPAHLLRTDERMPHDGWL